MRREVPREGKGKEGKASGKGFQKGKGPQEGDYSVVYDDSMMTRREHSYSAAGTTLQIPERDQVIEAVGMGWIAHTYTHTI